MNMLVGVSPTFVLYLALIYKMLKETLCRFFIILSCIKGDIFIMFRIIKYFICVIFIFALIFVINCSNNITEPKTTNNEAVELANLQNFPNPFIYSTTIRCAIPTTEHVSLIIYNTFNKPVRVLLDGYYNVGYHSIQWDSKDDNGNDIADGIYFCEFKYKNFQEIKIMLKK